MPWLALSVLFALAHAPVARAQEPDTDALTSAFITSFQSGEYEAAEAQVTELLRQLEADPDTPLQQRSDALSGLGLVRQRLHDFEGAVEILEQVDALVRANAASTPEQIATAQFNVAIAHADAGNPQRADAALTEVLVVFEEVYGPDHPFIAAVLEHMALIRREIAAPEDALPLLERSLEIHREAFGRESRQVATSLVNLSIAERDIDDLQAAQAHLEEAQEIYEAIGDADSVSLVLGERAGLHSRKGEYPEALALFESALVSDEALLGPDDPRVATVVNNLAILVDRMGDVDRSKELHERAYRIRYATFGPNHPFVADSAQNLGMYEMEHGKPQDAIALFSTALAIYEDTLGSSNARIATLLHNLGMCHDWLGNNQLAREYYERALTVLEEVFGPDHRNYATGLAHLANLIADQGDETTGLALLEKSLAIRRAALGAEHPDMAQAHIDLARLLRRLDHPEDARAHGELALQIQQTSLGADHPSLGDTLMLLALLSFDEGNTDEALALGERGMAIRAAALGADHPAIANHLESMASMVGARDPEAGIDLYRRARELWERKYGPAHLPLANNLAKTGLLYEALGDSDAALTHLTRALDMQTGRLELLGALSEREALAYVTATRQVLDRWLPLTTDADAAWGRVLAWKGLTIRAPEATNQDLPALRAVRRQIATLAYATGEHNEEIVALSLEKERLERLVAGGSSHREVAPEAVCAALPRGSALVDWFRVQQGETGRYLAFVVRAEGCRVQAIDMGAAGLIEDAVANWRAVLSETDASPQRIDSRGAAVTALVWTPLAPHLDEVERLFLSPDGPLSALPWAALPVADGYLIERRTIGLLQHPRDLLREPASKDGGLLVVGDVDFGGTSAASGNLVAMRAARCMDEDFVALPGTGTEAEAIVSLWEKQRRPGPITQLRAAGATESAFAGSLADQRIVHLSTHGFFATGTCRTATAAEDGTVVGYNPMLLSGVVLAGANDIHGPLDTDDGLLTAEEVATLDMHDTALVVLSACETGLGEIQSGEGVLGLQRAFSQAGAHSVVMTLWSIPDQATAALMGDFYGALLRRRTPMSATEALRHAQLKRLKAARAAGQARPQDWAAFIVSGD